MTGKSLIARLDQLFSQIPVKVIAPDHIPTTVISGIAIDSRKVTPGDLFIALVYVLAVYLPIRYLFRHLDEEKAHPR